VAYKFIKTIDPKNKHSLANIVFELPENDYDLTKLLEEFRCFLAACSFSVPGTIEYIEQEED
jgi:hypothetical protein